jgi:hypothetical protein
MELATVLMVKLLAASCGWSIGWTLRFAYTGAEPSRKNMAIVLCPWILILVYFFLFWWG